MFSRKKDQANITPGDPQIVVRYVGKVQTFVPSGKGCTQKPVQKIWDSADEERLLKRMSLLINPSGILLKGVDKKEEIFFDIKYISYCSAEFDFHEKIFAWIYLDSKSKKFECHAVLCSSKEKAQLLAVLISRAFQIAYKDWKTSKQKAERLQQISHQVKHKSEANNGASKGPTEQETNKQEVSSLHSDSNYSNSEHSNSDNVMSGLENDEENGDSLSGTNGMFSEQSEMTCDLENVTISAK